MPKLSPQASKLQLLSTHLRGLYMGREYVGEGVNMALGPIMNMGHSEGGGIWEVVGADPSLAGDKPELPRASEPSPCIRRATIVSPVAGHEGPEEIWRYFKALVVWGTKPDHQGVEPTT